MSWAYAGLDKATREALQLSRSQLMARLGTRAEYFDDIASMSDAFARYLLTDYLSGLQSGREQMLFIVPVGPVGQYERLAKLCGEGDHSLELLNLIVMDEYLTDAGDWIAETDPLSFRRHIREALLDNLPSARRPKVIVPDPRNIDAVGAAIERIGGVDSCYAGVGITGHLAFNDPVPGRDQAEFMASLPTRVVSLLPETRLINAVTASRGNLSRIPRMAVTVGMKEILAARRLRIFMNRDWQCAAIRRLACGPVTGAFPASLVQNHSNWSLHVVSSVLDEPEPGLR